MRMHVVQIADIGDPGARRDPAHHGRAAAMSRRRALAAGRSALAPAREQVRTGPGEAELRAPATSVDATPPTASNGRALSMQRRRQLSQGKQALNGEGDRAAAAAGTGAPTFIVLRGGAR
jgi:hypothetical protein